MYVMMMMMMMIIIIIILLHDYCDTERVYSSDDFCVLFAVENPSDT